MEKTKLLKARWAVVAFCSIFTLVVYNFHQLHRQSFIQLYQPLQSVQLTRLYSSYHDIILQSQNDEWKSKDFNDHKVFNLKVWNSDFHISPAADNKWILHHFNVTFVDKSLSGHCHLMNTCQTDLRVINTENGIDLSPCPNDVRREFYDSYHSDVEMKSIDIVLCTHAASMCELFMSFDKPMIIIASTRYEIGRHYVNRWKEWNQNLERIASKPMNVIAANNLFDVEYIKYFTSIEKVDYLPSLAGYITDRCYLSIENVTDHISDLRLIRFDRAQKQSSMKISVMASSSSLLSRTPHHNPHSTARREILIAPARGVNEHIATELLTMERLFHSGNIMNDVGDRDLISNSVNGATNNTMISSNRQRQRFQQQQRYSTKYHDYHFKHIRDLYPVHFEYSHLAQHPAIVILPYQISFMSFFEFYRMCIPMFVPSVELLTDWHLKYHVLNEKSWNSVFGRPPQSHSVLPRHQRSKSRMSQKHDPNDDVSRESLLQWLALADFYTYPFITTFDSWKDLMVVLGTTDLVNISKSMCDYNVKLETKVMNKWNSIFQRINDGIDKKDMPSSHLRTAKSPQTSIQHKKSSDPPSSSSSMTVNEALQQAYGVRLSDTCTGDISSPA